MEYVSGSHRKLLAVRDVGSIPDEAHIDDTSKDVETPRSNTFFPLLKGRTESAPSLLTK